MCGKTRKLKIVTFNNFLGKSVEKEFLCVMMVFGEKRRPDKTKRKRRK